MPEKIRGTWLRSKSSLVPGLMALFYCLAAYFGGAALILSLKPLLLAAGVLAMAHGMVIAAYLVHDCGHQSLFSSPRHNAALGGALNWLTGGCYATFEDVRRMHMRHHVDNADVTGFDHRRYLARHPRQLEVVKALEWLYIPAVEILMHAVVILRPFVSAFCMPGEKSEKKDKRSQRARTARIILIRFSLLAALLWHSPIAFACYLAAYGLFLTVLRFMDALQHNYEAANLSEDGEASAPRRGDRDYEQSHTFSNPISLRYPWLNLLTLNFGYHNAHHARPTAPWHELPGLHAALHARDAESVMPVIPFDRQLASFHRNRVARVMGDDAETGGKVYAMRLREGAAVGASGVSFLTPF